MRYEVGLEGMGCLGLVSWLFGGWFCIGCWVEGVVGGMCGGNEFVKCWEWMFSLRLFGIEISC